MKRSILIVTMLFGMRAVSQTTFSIAPIIYTKWSTSNYPGEDYFSGSGVGLSLDYMANIRQNAHYNYYVRRISKTSGVDIGIRLQASMKGGKHLLMFDWTSDVTKISSGINFLEEVYWTTSTIPPMDSIPPYPTYINGSIPFHGGYTYTRYSIHYGTRLIDKSPLLKLWLLFDISMARIGSMHGEGGYSYSDAPLLLDSKAKLLEIKQDDYQLDRRIFKFGIGLKSEFFITSKKKNTYLFTLEAHYRHGLKVMSSSLYRTLLEDKDGNLVAFSNWAESRGSGLYLQISRSFQLYPWKKKQQVTE